MFIYLNSVRSLNVRNAVKTVSSVHHIRRVFPITHYAIQGTTYNHTTIHGTTIHGLLLLEVNLPPHIWHQILDFLRL